MNRGRNYRTVGNLSFE